MIYVIKDIFYFGKEISKIISVLIIMHNQLKILGEHASLAFRIKENTTHKNTRYKTDYISF